MKNIFFIIFFIVAFFIINNLVRSIYDIWQKQDLVTKTERELQKEKDTHVKLQRQLRAVKDPQFIEEEARNKLFLVKPNEEVIVLPSSYPRVTAYPTPTPMKTQANWEQWWELFFSKKE